MLLFLVWLRKFNSEGPGTAQGHQAQVTGSELTLGCLFNLGCFEDPVGISREGSELRAPPTALHRQDPLG